jgi:mono/diheme cytochrome c family protein
VTRFAILALVLAGACSHETGGPPSGKDVFGTSCAACHGEKGKPSEANVARLNVRDLTAPEFRARATAALVENQVRKGSQNRLMPSFSGALSDAQIAAVAQYVASPTFPDH